MITNERIKNEYLPKAIEEGACWIAVYVIKQLLATGQQLKDHEEAPSWCYWYAQHVLRGRFREGEYLIMRNAGLAMDYARMWNFRWVEAEPRIAEQPFLAGLYATDVLMHLDPNAVETFLDSSEGSRPFFRRFTKKRPDWKTST